MALTHTAATRNAMASAVSAQIGSGGTLVLQTAADAILATFPLQASPFGAPTAGAMTLSGTPIEVAATAAGTAARFRFRNAATTEVFQGTVTATGGGGDLTIDNVVIANAQLVRVTGCTYTAPV
jgi:hypothetical protein